MEEKPKAAASKTPIATTDSPKQGNKSSKGTNPNAAARRGSTGSSSTKHQVLIKRITLLGYIMPVIFVLIVPIFLASGVVPWFRNRYLYAINLGFFCAFCYHDGRMFHATVLI